MRRTLLCLLVCAACSSPTFDPTAHAPTFARAEHDLSAESLQLGVWPQEKWWERYGDAQLSALIEGALKESPNVHQAEARRAYAKAYVKENSSALFPHLHLDLNTQWQHLARKGFFRAFTKPGVFPPNINLLAGHMNVDWNFDLFAKNIRRVMAARGNEVAARIEIDEVRRQLSAAIATSYFQLQGYYVIRSLLSEEISLRQELLALQKARYTHALDDARPTFQEDAALCALKANFQKVSESIELATHQILQLAGRDPSQEHDFHLQPLPLPVPPAIPPAIASELLLRRPDLQAQIERTYALALEVGAEKTSYFPSFDLVNMMNFAGFETVTFGSFFKSFAGSIMPAIGIPIFTAGKIRARIKEREAEFKESVAHYEGLLLRAAQEVVDALAMSRWSKERMREIEQEGVDQSKLLALEELRFNAALSPRQNSLESGLDFLSVRNEQALLLVEQLVAEVALIKALGGGYVRNP